MALGGPLSRLRAQNGAAPCVAQEGRPAPRPRAHSRSPLPAVGARTTAPQRSQRATPPGGEMAEPRSAVAEDSCWKRYVESELETARRWSHKWGFLKAALEELIEDEKKEKTKPTIQLPEHLRIRPVTPVEKYIKVNPSPPVPKTSQGFIGWRSAVPELQLEHCFQIQSCKGAFFKDLKWPREPSD
ncbi:uncharacterized protein C20orf85 homolog [Gallus gallus]|uniref:uncharacterized protein C20orf85 homolog n=1 Tax=Gallus gallus TaxID=9031 RepID=UPI001AE9C9D9|nr:uncharacterized protein C20orf85 homolog [Gallus gallus]